MAYRTPRVPSTLFLKADLRSWPTIPTGVDPRGSAHGRRPDLIRRLAAIFQLLQCACAKLSAVLTPCTHGGPCRTVQVLSGQLRQAQSWDLIPYHSAFAPEFCLQSHSTLVSSQLRRSPPSSAIVDRHDVSLRNLFAALPKNFTLSDDTLSTLLGSTPQVPR